MYILCLSLLLYLLYAFRGKCSEDKSVYRCSEKLRLFVRVYVMIDRDGQLEGSGSVRILVSHCRRASIDTSVQMC